MDPGTAVAPDAARAGGQKRQGRSRDSEDDRGAPVARGGAAASSSDWWAAESPTAGLGEGIVDRGDEAAPSDGHAAAGPDPRADQHPPANPGASPPDPVGGAVDAVVGAGAAGRAAGAAGAADAENALRHPSVRGSSVGAGAQAGGATEVAEGEIGQVDGIVVPSHCAGDTTAIGDARPDT